jgi:hypothetical protein
VRNFYFKSAQIICENSVCKSSLEKSIKNIIHEVMENYFDNEMLVVKIEKKKTLMNDIINEKLKEIKSNNFWYVNSSPNVCTFIHKRGKKEGFMCHRKINTNLYGEKPDYLCSTHSKKHNPKKRNKKIINKDVTIKKGDYKIKKKTQNKK